MRFHLTLMIVLVLIVFTATACNKNGTDNQRGGRAESAPQTNAQPADGIRRISIPELQAALEKGEAVAVDVRGGVEYNLGHIKGALSIPLGLLAERSGELPRDKLIVTYCACTHEQLSVRAVQDMKKLGIENGAALLGGWDEWKRMGLPAE